MAEIKGKCLCGSVTVTAETDDPKLRACHCDMCRQHTSGAFFSIKTVQGSEKVVGRFKTYRSSDWAERGFCPNCGSTLWYATVEDKVRNFAAGLFPNAGDAPMVIEFYADQCPQGYALAGDHKKLTSAETEALFAGGGN